MHVAQIEHRLGTMLLLCCQAVVNKGSFIINVGAKTIEMIVAQLESSYSVTYQQKKKGQWAIFQCVPIIIKGISFQCRLSCSMERNLVISTS